MVEAFQIGEEETENDVFHQYEFSKKPVLSVVIWCVFTIYKHLCICHFSAYSLKISVSSIILSTIFTITLHLVKKYNKGLILAVKKKHHRKTNLVNSRESP